MHNFGWIVLNYRQYFNHKLAYDHFTPTIHYQFGTKSTNVG
jgi:hypothetical protein